MRVGGQRHAPAALPPGKTRYPLYRKLGERQGRSGRVRKISPSTGIRSPDRSARSESLYRLSYPGLQVAIPTELSRPTYIAYPAVKYFSTLSQTARSSEK
jgi:hypothetical protein